MWYQIWIPTSLEKYEKLTILGFYSHLGKTKKPKDSGAKNGFPSLVGVSPAAAGHQSWAALVGVWVFSLYKLWSPCRQVRVSTHFYSVLRRIHGHKLASPDVEAFSWSDLHFFESLQYSQHQTSLQFVFKFRGHWSRLHWRLHLHFP